MAVEGTDSGEVPQKSAATLRSIAPSIFLPALVFEIGNGAIAPVIVLTAVGLGASTGAAAFTVALLGIGRVVGDVPASWLADRVGDRRSMMIAAALAMAGFVVCMLSISLIVMNTALMGIGMASATFYLARQSYVIDVAPTHLLARAMSTMAGSHRIGLFIGPFIGAAAIGIGGVRAVYGVGALSAASAVLVLVLIPDLETPGGARSLSSEKVGTYATIAANRRLLATLGFAVLTAGAVRAARQTVVPLWAQHLGLSPLQTSLIFGIANSVDMALFYPAGKIMDKFGRLAIALPAMIILGGSMMALPACGSSMSLAIVAIVMSFGNGIGSGIIATLGADAAPKIGRLRFLGIFRLVSDSGNAAGPVVVSVVGTIWTLSGGIVTAGFIGLVSAGSMAAWVPKYTPYGTRKSVRAHSSGDDRSPPTVTSTTGGCPEEDRSA